MHVVSYSLAVEGAASITVADEAHDRPCQQNSTAILHAANWPENSKSDVLKSAEEHLRIVQVEWSFYKTSCDECKRTVNACFTGEDGVFKPPAPLDAPHSNLEEIEVHYSFDYAQQVHYPLDPLQLGPIYFLAPGSVACLGCIVRQFLARSTSSVMRLGTAAKGQTPSLANCTTSLPIMAWAKRRCSFTQITALARTSMLHYLAWRVMAGLHTQITLSFLVVGHTKFAPDWCFGLFKRLYRRTRVESLQAIASVVNNSAKCNIAQLVVMEDGTTVVPTYNWTDLASESLMASKGTTTLDSPAVIQE